MSSPEPPERAEDARMGEAEGILFALGSDPLLRSDFAALLVLDRLPGPKRLRVAVERMVAAFPIMRRRPVSSPLRAAPPLWVDDVDFDLDYHLRHLAVPAPGGQRELLDLVAVLSAPLIDPERPLWEMTVIEGLAGGRAALLARLHHAVADGVIAVRMLRALLDPPGESFPDSSHGAADEPADDPADDPADESAWIAAGGVLSDPTAGGGDADPPDNPPPLGPLELAGAEVAHRVWRGLVAARGAARVLSELSERPETVWASLARGRELIDALREQAFVSGGALSPLLTGRSLARRYEMLAVPLERVRRAATALGVSRREVVVASVLGGLGAYHDAAGTDCDEVRVGIPLRGAPGGAMGERNRFVAVRLALPLRPADPGARVAEVARRLRAVADHPVTSLAAPLSELAGLVPLAVLHAIARSQAHTVDFGTSMVPRLPARPRLGGVEVTAAVPFGPRLGTAFNATAGCSGGELHLGFHLDPAAVAEPEALVARVQDAFDELFAATTPRRRSSRRRP